MGSNYRVNYSVDLVFCIDATMSMDYILDTVKKNALNFYKDFTEEMVAKHKSVTNLRIRIIAFRDYLSDGNQSMMSTKFFDLPYQESDFHDCVNSIVADGGGDDPEDGLEALAYAIKSEWNTEARKNRHVIVVWSDEGTHEIGFGKSSEYYPNGMPKDFNELTEWWGSQGCPGIMDESSKRLILFTPNKSHWDLICNNWNNVIQYESDAGNGLRDVDYKQILSAICNSI